MILPWPVRRLALQMLFGYRIHPDAKIGISILNVRRLEMGQGSRIGHLTIMKGLLSAKLEEFSSIGHLNWITAYPYDGGGFFEDQAGRSPSLSLHRHASITHRHLIDCTDLIEIGPFTTIAGWRSQFLTHSIDVTKCRQIAAGIKIGAYCFVGTGVVILKGATLPDMCVLAAGSVLTGPVPTPLTLYSGVPAVASGELKSTSRYFARRMGNVR